MKKQATFLSDLMATEWLTSLSKCFEIQKATITKILVRYRDTKQMKWKVEAKFR